MIYFMILLPQTIYLIGMIVGAYLEAMEKDEKKRISRQRKSSRRGKK